jgi:hypothetical protein
VIAAVLNPKAKAKANANANADHRLCRSLTMVCMHDSKLRSSRRNIRDRLMAACELLRNLRIYQGALLSFSRSYLVNLSAVFITQSKRIFRCSSGLDV